MACSTPSYINKLKDSIEEIFVFFIRPHNVLSYFHKYDTRILSRQDTDNVIAVTNTQGDSIGSARLLKLLCIYPEWLDCLVQVLRDPMVKLNHVADKILDKKRELDQGIQEDHRKREEEIRRLQEEIQRKDAQNSKLKREERRSERRRNYLNQIIQKRKREKRERDLIIRKQKREMKEKDRTLQKQERENLKQKREKKEKDVIIKWHERVKYELQKDKEERDATIKRLREKQEQGMTCHMREQDARMVELESEKQKKDELEKQQRELHARIAELEREKQEKDDLIQKQQRELHQAQVKTLNDALSTNSMNDGVALFSFLMRSWMQTDHPDLAKRYSIYRCDTPPHLKQAAEILASVRYAFSEDVLREIKQQSLLDMKKIVTTELQKTQEITNNLRDKNLDEDRMKLCLLVIIVSFFSYCYIRITTIMVSTSDGNQTSQLMLTMQDGITKIMDPLVEEHGGWSVVASPHILQRMRSWPQSFVKDGITYLVRTKRISR